MLLLVGGLVLGDLHRKPRIQPRQQDRCIPAQGLGILIPPQEPHLLVRLTQDVPQACSDVEVLVILHSEQRGNVRDGFQNVKDGLGLVGGDAPVVFDHLDRALADDEGRVGVGKGGESVGAEGGDCSRNGLVCYAGFGGEGDFGGRLLRG